MKLTSALVLIAPWVAAALVAIFCSAFLGGVFAFLAVGNTAYLSESLT